MKKNICNLGVKSLSLILSGVLIFQSGSPAFASAGASSGSAAGFSSSAPDIDAKLDNAYLASNISADQYEEVLRKNVQKQKDIIKPLAKQISSLRTSANSKYPGNSMQANMYVGIKGVNAVGKLTYELKSFLAYFYAKRSIMPFKEFKKAYDEHIKKEAAAYAKENNYPVKKLTSLLEQQFPAKQMYNEYKAIAQQELNWYKANKTKVDESAYKVLREYVKAYGVNMDFEALSLLSNLKLNGKDVITEAEKQSIHNYAVNRIKNLNLNNVFDVSYFTSSKTKESHAKVAARALQDNINMIMIGGITAPSYPSAYVNAVLGLVKKSTETVAFPYMLQAGVGSLLGIKQYKAVDNLLAHYTALEGAGDSVWEMFSTEYGVNAINKTQGSYLRGKSSRGAQYVSENQVTYYNAFTDIAKLLGQEGSDRSLAILKKYAIDSKAPIMPFLAGALLTGKVSPAESKASKESGLSPAAFMALKLVNMNMADLSDSQEGSLDTQLIGKYPSIKNKLGEYAVYGADKMKAKRSRRVTLGYFQRFGAAVDIAFMVWATFDLLKLARSTYSLGRATFTVMQLSRISNPAIRSSKIIANASKIKPYVAARTALRSFSGRMKGAMAGVVMGQRHLYTAEALPAIKGAGAANTTTAKVLGTVTYDAGKGGLVVDRAAALSATAGEPGRVTEILDIERTLAVANENARNAYLSRSWFSKKIPFIKKYRDYGYYLSSATQNAFRNGKYSGYALEAGLDFGLDLKNFKLAAPDAAASSSFNWLARPLSAAGGAEGTVGLWTRGAAGLSEADPLPVDVSLNGTRFWPWSKKHISGIKVQDIDNVLITGNEGSSFKLSFGKSGVIADPSYFKIGLDNGSFADLARLTLGGNTPLTLKFLPEQTSTWGRFTTWGKNFFTSKSKMFSGTGSVWVKDAASGKNIQTPIRLITSSDFNGVKVLVNEDGRLSFLARNKAGNMISFNNPYSFAIPKGQLGVFTNYAKAGTFNNPLGITITASRDKVNTLYLLQVLSLSAASTGLIGPLRQNYPEMTNTQETLITVALPYLPSFLSPFWAPFVKRFGSANMMMTSLGLSAASLAISTGSGFGGWSDANIYNPNKPSLTPLLLSASFIGLASSLTRASFNPLMKEMGGGGGLLKGMMYKNAGSFLMILPPVGFQLWDQWSPRYYTDDGTINGNPLRYQGADVYADGKLKLTNGQEILAEDGGPLLHKHTDFSVSNPVLLGLTGVILYKFRTANFSKEIGAVKGYEMSQSVKPINWLGTSKFSTGFNNYLYRPAFGVLKESVSSAKVMFRKEVLPLTLAGFGALGVEASMFNKYSQSEANAYLRNDDSPVHVGSETWRPVIATTALALPQFAVRYFSKPLIAALGGENPATYRKIIGLSLGSAAAGTGLLAVENDPWTFALGMSLIGAGFANTTNGILMTGEYNLMRAGASKGVLTDWKVAYPAVHIGMSVVPVAHNYFADKEVEKDPENISKTKALQDNIWIPASVLFGTGLLYGKGSGAFKSGQIGRYFAPIKHGAALTFPYFRAQDWLNRTDTPSFLQVPSLTPSFDLSVPSLSVSPYNLNSLGTQGLQPQSAGN